MMASGFANMTKQIDGFQIGNYIEADGWFPYWQP